MEFHISRLARNLYQFDQSLFSISGNVIFANFHAARLFTQKMNQKRDLIQFPEQAVRAGQINAMGMIDEILHYVIGLYRQQVNPLAIRNALAFLDQSLGREIVDRALWIFTDEFPPLAVYTQEQTVGEYLQGQTGEIPNRQIALEEMLLLWLANVNPAMGSFNELFDDSQLNRLSGYAQIIKSLHSYFDTQPPFGPDRQNLIDMLRSPAIAAPYSLPGQLEYIRERWAVLLGSYLYRLLGSLDLLKEEDRAFFAGPGPTIVIDYLAARGFAEPERFSTDREWMPTLVLIAKNAYVWLDQLSKQYQRSITRLDQIPDEELETLHTRGISGLWLIGVWERSRASQRIKQLTGNLEAVASAYSLDDYRIAADLGGSEAYQNLKDRAWRRHIRMASDMVPNHMGIDSQWVLEHPDWFISLDHAPYPSYSFSGPDLSLDPQVGIFLEDHYYNRTDAAVGFLRRDYRTGVQKFIYHGNDGTSTPWNDTAQLDYLKPEVREAVIQTILHVARQFPIIRFDAAMTLAKKHYQRLWFPEPGTGGAIPSRSEHSLTREQFDRLMPEEFWREVVDRVALETPDTLLLAEAFWLMEGYFVRTLGMHRVYNSAFMNMLRNEENSKYRAVMKNTLEFDPEILKRFVNFMNNPDERTALDQFGKGDKYFGVCTLMATLPGLPMFGHGQIEGFAEKYGMEYRRAYLDEKPDPNLIERHEREIFPLLRQRYLFAGVENFLLYDVFTPEGYVNEDIFAYSNGTGNERVLVLYHNKYATASGWVRTSVGQLSKTGGTRAIIQKSLGEGLGLHDDAQHFTIFRDQNTGLEYIRSSHELCINGLRVEMNAYQYHVLMNIHEVTENEWGHYGQLATYLNGSGVPSIQEALSELVLQPIHQPYRSIANPEIFSQLEKSRCLGPGDHIDILLLDQLTQRYRELLFRIKERTGGYGSPDEVSAGFRSEMEMILQLPVIDTLFPLPNAHRYQAALNHLQNTLSLDPSFWITLFAWCLTHRLGDIVSVEENPSISRSWMDEWRLGKIIADVSREMGVDEAESWHIVNRVKLMISEQNWMKPTSRRSAHQLVLSWLEDPEIRVFLGVNRYQGILWFNQQAFDTFLSWLYVIAIIQSGSRPGNTPSSFIEGVLSLYDVISEIKQSEEKSGFQVDQLIQALEDGQLTSSVEPHGASKKPTDDQGAAK